MSEQYLIANGLRLAYEDFGDKKNPAIILIMGIGSQMILWPESMCKALAEKGFYVVRFDNRDTGLSQKLELRKPVFLPRLLFKYKFKLPFSGPYRLSDMAKDTIGLIDALEINKAHWVGVSMGGMIAQVLAAQYPERTLSMTSIMSNSGNRELPLIKPSLLKQLIFQPQRKKEKAFIKHGIQTWRLLESPDYPSSEEELTKRVLDSLRRNYYPASFNNHLSAILESGDRRGLLRKITAPSLIIHGKKDPLFPVECGIDTANNIKDSTLKLIPGMGHDLPEALIPRLVELILEHANNCR